VAVPSPVMVMELKITAISPESSAISKSSVSQWFIKASEEEAQKVLSRRFETENIPVLLIDGIVLSDYTAIVAMGITSDGRKLVMGIRIGSTENAQNWKNGTMVQRWISAALLDAEQRAHRIPGYRSMGVLINEIKRLINVAEIESIENESKTA